jgi:RNA polymerase sigma factor (sigma-70 family)
VTENELIQGCKNGDPICQKAFYDVFSPKMFAVCLRYLQQKEDAEDILIEGLYKVMSNMHKYDGLGSFEGWVRRIMINESLMFIRKKYKVQFESNELLHNEPDNEAFTIESDLAVSEILKLIEKLPVGYKTIFNLYVLEGYKHKEIAEMLNISINTSKSQLIQAKDKLQSLIKKYH